MADNDSGGMTAIVAIVAIVIIIAIGYFIFQRTAGTPNPGPSVNVSLPGSSAK